MSSLREQIELVIKKTKDNVLLNDSEITNIILDLFKKRIDVLKQKYPNDLYRAYNAALDDVIEEILKK